MAATATSLACGYERWQPAAGACAAVAAVRRSSNMQSLPPPSTLQILRPWPTAKMAAVRAAVRAALRCRATLLGSGWPALAGCGAAAAAAAAASAGCDDLRPTPRPAAWPASTAALIEELCVLLPAPPLPPTTGG